MPDYIQLSFQNISAEQNDLLIAALSMAGFEGFEEAEHSLQSFIPVEEFEENRVLEIAARYQVAYSKTVIKETNWNAVWESNFQPVIVDDFVAIRAHFHETIPGVEHEIVITPKMSFGTGHHATTFMMIRMMREIDCKNKTVFDFGTGTGILAILAAGLGAHSVIAVDHDDWSIENTRENLQKNCCTVVDTRKADNADTGEQFDIILANINKNVILDNISLLSSQLNKAGILLLSGLLEEDEHDIVQAAKAVHCTLEKKIIQNGWICLKFSNEEKVNPALI